MEKLNEIILEIKKGLRKDLKVSGYHMIFFQLGISKQTSLVINYPHEINDIIAVSQYQKHTQNERNLF